MLQGDLRGFDGVPVSSAEEAALLSRISILEVHAECGELTLHERLELARLHMRLDNTRAALVWLLPLLCGDQPCPQALMLRGMIRLRRDRPDGVHDLFAAAAADPRLLGKVAAHVEQWLSGRGRRYDSEALRGELARMRRMHAQGRAERQMLDDYVVLRPVRLDPGEETALREALAPFAGDMLAGWLAERLCDHLPRWRHLELLVEARPGLLWPPRRVRKRLRDYQRRMSAALPELPGMSLSLRVAPLLARRNFVRQMRLSAGRPLITPGDA